MSTSAVELSEYSLIRISGTESVDFLQGQLTQDIDAVTKEKSALAGWTSVKGRLFMVAPVTAWQDAYYLPVPAEVSASLLQRLRMYVLRAQVSVELSEYAAIGLVDLETNQDLRIGALQLDAAPAAAASNQEICVSRVIGDPSRAWLFGDRQDIGTVIESAELGWSSEQTWELRNVQMGLPVIGQAISEAFIPQMLNLDLIGGISFTKGCYLGQEIVARTQNLGRIKRRMYRFGADSRLGDAPGMNVFGPENVTGKIVATAATATGTELLAVVPIDESGGQWFADEDRAISLARLTLPYTIPE